MEGSGRYAIAMFAPITVLYLIFLIAPISFFLAMSVFKYSPLELYVVTVTGDNFLRLLGDDYYRAIIFRTLKIAGLTALFSLLLGYPLAYFLARTQSVWRGCSAGRHVNRHVGCVIWPLVQMSLRQ